MGKTASGRKRVRKSRAFDRLSVKERDQLVSERVFGGRDLGMRPYSTDLVACMLIVDEMSSEGYAFKSRVLPDGRAIVSFTCDESPCDRHSAEGPHGAREVEGKTLAIAICNAALTTRT